MNIYYQVPHSQRSTRGAASLLHPGHGVVLSLQAGLHLSRQAGEEHVDILRSLSQAVAHSPVGESLVATESSQLVSGLHQGGENHLLLSVPGVVDLESRLSSQVTGTVEVMAAHNDGPVLLNLEQFSNWRRQVIRINNPRFMASSRKYLTFMLPSDRVFR